MPILTSIVHTLCSGRLRAIDRYASSAAEIQYEQFRKLTERLSNTRYGEEHRINGHGSYDYFREHLPVVTYDEIAPYIDRMRSGEEHVLWDRKVEWYAKSSGTTASKSKFIPVSPELLESCHLQGPRDVLALFTRNYPESNVFSGKTITLGGSHAIDELSKGGARSGDLSAIMIQHTPMIAAVNRLPSKEVALLPDFEEKVARICAECVDKNVTSFAGVPSWNMVMLNKVLEYTGKSNICEVWPNMELFIHGGVNFKPYREQYRKLIPSPAMKYMETYNASEGFFAIQDNPAEEDMLLMLDYGIFYEFLEVSDLHDTTKTVPLEGVRPGVNYAMIVSTAGGLWRYLIGDTVTFTSVRPYKIRITGRTKLFINTFGEEIIIDNAEQALAAACRATGAQISEYTAAPVYMEAGSKGSHQWLIEFAVAPTDPELFACTLDRRLQEVNSDYEAKRKNDTTLYAPQVVALPAGTFYRWMKSRGKAGGQNKVPRLANDRRYADELLTFESNQK